MVISSTIDKIKDTTIMRSLRKLAGLMDEQNASIDAVNERLDNFDLSGVESDIATLKTDVSQVEISVGENTEHLKTVDSTLNNHATEISSIKAKDVSQDSEIQGLNESVVSDLTGEFNNTTRTLKLSVERESAPSIDCSVVIPAGGSTGNYTGGTGIDINSNNVISAKIDNSTIKVNSSGQMYSVGGGSGGKVYSAGNGIDISDSDVISVKSDVVALKSDIADMETKTSASETYATKSQLQTLQSQVGDAFSEVSYDNMTGVFTYKALDGQENTLELPTFMEESKISSPTFDMLGLISGGLAFGAQGVFLGWLYEFYTQRVAEDGAYVLVPATDDKTIHFNSKNQLEVIGGSSSPAKFTPQFFTYDSSGDIYSKLTELETGTFVSINSMGKTTSSWSGTISGILKSKSSSGVQFVVVGCSIWDGSAIVPAGTMNYTNAPVFTVTSNYLHINIQKGNSITGKSFEWSDSQGCNITIFN